MQLAILSNDSHPDSLRNCTLQFVDGKMEPGPEFQQIRLLLQVEKKRELAGAALMGQEDRFTTLISSKPSRAFNPREPTVRQLVPRNRRPVLHRPSPHTPYTCSIRLTP